jgi:dTDP-4-dehydrorhamnose 3,5-epimerase-like enzyme
LGTAHVLEAARLNPTVKRMIVASSDKAYGAQPVLPYTEEASLQGRHPYDVSKSCTDLLAQMYYHTYKLPVCVTRCGNLYGPGDLNWQRIVPETIKHALHNEAPIIRSDGQFIRDYFFVRDAANAYITLAENMDRPDIVGQAFNFSTGNGKTVLHIVDAILRASGRTDLQPIIKNEAKAEIHDQTLSSEKAWKFLNWKPTYTLEEGLAETVAWYREYFAKQQSGNDPSPQYPEAPMQEPQFRDATGQKGRAVFSNLPSLQNVSGGFALDPSCRPRESGDPATQTGPLPDSHLRGNDTKEPDFAIQSKGQLAGVTLTPLKIFADERGQVMHMIRRDSPTYKEFGKVYFSGLYAGIVKGWKVHTRAWQNISVPQGRVRYTLHDQREGSPTAGQSMTVTLGDHNYQLLTIPPGIATAWKNIGQDMALIASCSTVAHDPSEAKDLPLTTFPYPAS